MQLFSWLHKRMTGRPQTRSTPARKPAPRFRSQLETLERRDLPAALLFVVPLNAPTDATHFHDLTTALTAAAFNDFIQVEPNSAPGVATVSKLVTIQGDPATTPANLPQLGDLTIAASDVTLTGLNLHAVTINAGFDHTTITGCLVVDILDQGGSGNGFTTVRNNVITDTVVLAGNTAGATDDLIEGNIITRQNLSVNFGVTVSVNAADGSVIQGNTVTSTTSGNDGIGVTNSTNVLIRGNTVRVHPVLGAIVVGATGVSTSATITDNIVQSDSGSGIYLLKLSRPLSAALSGNDLVNNRVGISIQGDRTTVGTIDLGGGPLGSTGNNDLRLFNGTSDHFAIQVFLASGDTIQAQNNLFSGSPAATIDAPPGETVNATALSANAAFVERLYANYLHRAGSPSEIAGWVMLAASNPQAVVQGIGGSMEADGVLVEGLYQRLLGRSAIGDSGASGWVTLLQAGMSEEQLITGIAGSQEFYNRATGLGSTGSADQRFITALYHVVLGRTADPSAAEVSGWVATLPSLGPAGVVQAILTSTEYRNRAVTVLYFADLTVGSTPTFLSIPAQWVGTTLADWLHRSSAPTMVEVNGWVNSGMDVLAIEAAFANSAEFFSNG